MVFSLKLYIVEGFVSILVVTVCLMLQWDHSAALMPFLLLPALITAIGSFMAAFVLFEDGLSYAGAADMPQGSPVKSVAPAFPATAALLVAWYVAGFVLLLKGLRIEKASAGEGSWDATSCFHGFQ